MGKIEYKPVNESMFFVLKKAVNIAKNMNQPVYFDFNDIECKVFPDTDVHEAHSYFVDVIANAQENPSVLIFEPNRGVIENIKQWVRDRRLHTADPKTQLGKLMEESGELAGAILKGQHDDIVDGVGDCVVVLICLCEQLGIDFDECIEGAYDEIKDRKGQLIDGVFVKEEDLKPGY